MFRSDPSRREFMQQLAASACLSPMLLAEASAAEATSAAAQGQFSPTGSDVGSLYPFIQSQAVKGEFPLSFLNGKFSKVAAWKREAREKVFELLQYAPPTGEFRPEIVERTDC